MRRLDTYRGVWNIGARDGLSCERSTALRKREYKTGENCGESNHNIFNPKLR